MSEENKKILIVEDEEPLRKALAERLGGEAGIEPIEAADGEEAVRLAQEHVPDLILLDINMPKKDGLAAFKEIRTSEWGKSVDVMFLTNSADLSTVAEVQEYGLVDYLTKADWDIEDIVQRIREKLSL